MNSVIDTVSLADSVGFVVHPNKSSVLKPTQEIMYLGFVPNSREMTEINTRKSQKDPTRMQLSV